MKEYKISYKDNLSNKTEGCNEIYVMTLKTTL